MSAIFEYMKISIQHYVDKAIPVDTFRAEFAGACFYARNRIEEKEANLLASLVIGPIAEFAGGHRSEESLRTELMLGLRPFVSFLPGRKMQNLTRSYAGAVTRNPGVRPALNVPRQIRGVFVPPKLAHVLSQREPA